MITVVGFEPTTLTVVPSIQWMLASLAIQGLVLLRRTHPHFVRTLDYFVIESWYEDPALTNWATLQVQAKGLEPLTVGLEIRCADPLRHVCIKVGMMGIEPIFTLLGPTAYKAVALTCWATSQPLREDSNLQPSHVQSRWTTIVLHRDIKYRARVELTESGFADRTATATYGTYSSRNRNRTYIFWVRVMCHIAYAICKPCYASLGSATQNASSLRSDPRLLRNREQKWYLYTIRL